MEVPLNFLTMLPLETIKAQLPYCLEKTNFPKLGDYYQGKVRDNYTFGDQRILIVTDRISAFDRVICLIPFKGQVLNQMAEFWFEKTRNIVGNHALEFPDPNVCVAEECQPLPIEMVVRGYITGVTTTSAWYNYERGVRNFCGNILPEGLRKNQKLEKPIITPSTKAVKGGHDESLSGDEIFKRGLLGSGQWEKMKDISLKLYARGGEICAKQGIILVDTKYELGLNKKGEIVLIDEIYTPDSSRFWFADEYEERFQKGIEQKKIDKEYLREWLAEHGFLGQGEIPKIPDEVKIETARRYIEAFELITGQSLKAEVGPIEERIKNNLQKYLK